MTDDKHAPNGHRSKTGSLVLWGGAACLLIAPALAMQMTDAVQWSGGDFVLFAMMLGCACGGYELAARSTGNIPYRTATAVALVTAFCLVLVNLAVGFIGSEDNPVNLIYAGVLALGFAGSAIARFRPKAMAITLIAMAVAQLVIGGIVWVAGLDQVLVPTAAFTSAWLLSAWLFWWAARQRTVYGAVAI